MQFSDMVLFSFSAFLLSGLNTACHFILTLNLFLQYLLLRGKLKATGGKFDVALICQFAWQLVLFNYILGITYFLVFEMLL